MKQTNTKATILMYTLFLVSIALIMAVVILNLSLEIFNNNEFQNTARKLSNNVAYKANIGLKYHKFLNANGSGFLDNTSCPTSISMSGSTSSGVVSSTLGYISGRGVCNGTYAGTGFQIVWNSDYTAFSGAYFQGNIVSFLSGAIASATFSDIDNTMISFATTGLAGIDGIDDDMNNDDYRVTGTGNTYYPDGAEDDDAQARKMIYFYLPPGGGMTNILWTNKKYADFIAKNPNNSDTLNAQIGSVSSGTLFIESDKDFSLKIVKFDKAKYDMYQELEATQVITSPQMFGRIGYIQNNGTVSTSGIGVKTGQEMMFDFVNNDYAIFLNNYSTGTLLFNLKGFTESGSGVYINPIDDTDSNILRFLGNDIVIDDDGKYAANQFEIIDIKDTFIYLGPCIIGSSTLPCNL